MSAKLRLVSLKGPTLEKQRLKKTAASEVPHEDIDHSTKYNYENKNNALFHTSSVRHAINQL